MTKLQEFLHFCELKLTGEQLAEFWQNSLQGFHREYALSSVAQRIYEDICEDPGMRDAAQVKLAADIAKLEDLQRSAAHTLAQFTAAPSFYGHALRDEIRYIGESVARFSKSYDEAVKTLESIAKAKVGDE